MLEIMLQIVDNHMSESTSQQYAEEYVKHKIVEMFFKKCLQTGESLSEYIFFADPIEKEISRQKCYDIEYPIPIDINRSDRKCNHDYTSIDKMIKGFQPIK